MTPEDQALQNIGYALVIISAALAALCIYAIWTGIAQ